MAVLCQDVAQACGGALIPAGYWDVSPKQTTTELIVAVIGETDAFWQVEDLIRKSGSTAQQPARCRTLADIDNAP